ncbi:hypothetical protein HDE_04951 [Halotydeus destructor]|nr:hypothetical protein HDE_04951 [Halotydeus destructor]
MKVAIFMAVIFLAYYTLAGSPPVSKNPGLDSKRRNNETDREYKERMGDLGIFTLPGGKCYHDGETSLDDEWCIPKMDSCCYGMFKCICIGRKHHWGRCKRHQTYYGPADKYLHD